MSAEIASRMAERTKRGPASDERRQRRVLAVRLLGPLTILIGLAWAVVQPYRITFLYPHGKSFYDFLAQPPLLVVLMGVLFMVLVAPGLAADLEGGERGPKS